MTWEEAVSWLRSQPDRQELVRDCYFDDPLLVAAERFSEGEEWQAVAALLGTHLPGKVLDLGAGRGIATYAFARQDCQVTALEPNPSPLVGRGAIAALLKQSDQAAEILVATGEYLPCADATFDVVYGRAVLHHAEDLEQVCREAARVLRRGGAFLATREHVLSHPQELAQFLAEHPLHALYGGENAYLLERYVGAIRSAGFHVAQIIGPFDSPVNHAPLTRYQVLNLVYERLARYVGRHLARILVNRNLIVRLGTHFLSARCRTPGRHYSFMAYKQ